MSCLSQVMDFVKEQGIKVSDSTIRELEAHMQRRIKEGITPAEFAAEMAELIDKDMALWAQAKKTAKLMDLAKIESVPEGYKRNKALGLNAYEYFRAVLEGGALKSGDGTNLNTALYEKTLFAKFLGMFNQLDKIKDEIESGLLDREIVQEKNALQGKGTIGESGSKEAAQAAALFHSLQREMFDSARALNPLMRFAKDYFFEQSHSRVKVSAVDRDYWINKIFETHGEKSFPDLDPVAKREVLGNIYDQIVSGTYGSIVAGGGDLRFRMARARTLIPNDWQAFYNYHKEFGEGTIAQTMLKTMRNRAREIAQLEKFGANRSEFFERAYARLYSEADAEDRVLLQSKKESLRKSFNTAIGLVDAPAVGIRAKLVQGALSFEYMAKGGLSAISSIPDFWLSTSLMKDVTGKNMAGLAADLAQIMIKTAANPEEARNIMSKVGLYSEVHSAVLARELGSDQLPMDRLTSAQKKFKSATELYGKLTLLPRYLDAHRAADGILVAKQFAEVADKEYGQLEKVTQKSLLRYGIGESEWNLLRQSVEEVPFRGDTYKLMTMEGIQSLPDDVVEAHMREAGAISEGAEVSKELLNQGRLQLQMKLGAMINEIADLGTSTPGIRQRGFLLGGESINSGWGQIRRITSQFKGATLVSSDVVRRRYYSGIGPKGNWAGVGSTVAGLAFFGFLGQYARDFATGKTPASPTDPAFLLNSLSRSGAGGPYMDVLLGEAQRTGVSDMMLSAYGGLAGPVAGSAIEAGALALQYGKAAVTPRERAPNARAIRFLTSSLPGQNLFWATGALNYYIFNGWKEEMDHGFVGTLMRKVNKTPGLFEEKQRYFMFNPAERAR